MVTPIAERIREIDWAPYRTAYGGAAEALAFERRDGSAPPERWGSIADQLVRLAAPDEPQAMKASHQLWCCLCHQHARVSSAALPALPFLLEILDSAPTSLKVEILDILRGFAVCSAARSFEPPGDWGAELRRQLQTERPRFVGLGKHPAEQVADLARSIVQSLPEP